MTALPLVSIVLPTTLTSRAPSHDTADAGCKLAVATPEVASALTPDRLADYCAAPPSPARNALASDSWTLSPSAPHMATRSP
jgi:hypothetical protein